MKSIKVNGILFRGQHANAYEKLLNGGMVTIKDFKNGTWEATTPYAKFISNINKAGVQVIKLENTSIRKTKLILKEEHSNRIVSKKLN